MIDAAVRRRVFHDAELCLLLLAFFIAVALPVHWYTVIVWSFIFCISAIFQGSTLGFVLKSLALAFALSISVWLLNVFFHTAEVSKADALVNANQTALKIWSLTWVALLSSKMVNLRDVITFCLQCRWLSVQIAYAMLAGLGSMTLLFSEAKRINLNAKLRGIKGLHKFSQWIPLLIFALRHAQRSTMSLRARGLASRKTFYYNYQITLHQHLRFIILLLCFTILTLVSEYHLLCMYWMNCT